MNGFDKRVSEMLGRVQAFAADHPELFEKSSPAGRVLEELQTEANSLSEHYVSQTVGKEDGKVSTSERSAAREALRLQLEAIGRAAHALNLSDFWTPHEHGDHGLIQIAKIFLTRAEPLAQKFIDEGLPPDFVSRLNTAIRRLEKAIVSQASRTNSRLTATSGIEQSRTVVLSTLERLDAILENKLGSGSPLFIGWNSARHVERYGRGKRNSESIETSTESKTDVPAA